MYLYILHRYYNIANIYRVCRLLLISDDEVNLLPIHSAILTIIIHLYIYDNHHTNNVV